MADLLDIVPALAVESVSVSGGHHLKVRGVTLPALALLVSRFPDLKSLVNGGGDGDIVSRLIAGCGAATGPIIAAGCDRLGDAEYEKTAAEMLLPEDQLRILAAIVRLTFPNGIGSFVETLTKMLNPADDERAKPKFVKLRWKQSQPMSPPSSGTAEDSSQTMQ